MFQLRNTKHRNFFFVLSSLFLKLLFIFCVSQAFADNGRDKATEDAGDRTKNGAQQQQNLGDIARALANKYEDEAKGQDAVCAS